MESLVPLNKVLEGDQPLGVQRRGASDAVVYWNQDPA